MKQILNNYSTDNIGVKTNLWRMLNHGYLKNTGKLLIAAVDQGMEHGPDRSFQTNALAYDPEYHFELAIEGGLSGYAAPLGWMEAGIEKFYGQIPLILKINSSNSLLKFDNDADQAITASIDDALRLGCSAIGFTIYPGSQQSLEQLEELQELSQEAKSCGLAVIVWSYPRGNVSKTGETSLDVVTYGAHMAAMLGAHIIKVKIPSQHIEFPAYNHHTSDDLAARIQHVMRGTFFGKRMVIFSGGETKNEDILLQEAQAIKNGKGSGMIIGRNLFQRPKDDALRLIGQLTKIFRD